MKALTIWQPWATLIAVGIKPYEFRAWQAPKFVIGQRIAIHAGARPIKMPEIVKLIGQLQGNAAWDTGLRRDDALALLTRVRDNPDILPRSAIVCTAVVGVPVNAFDILKEFGGPVNDSDRDKHANWAWPMRDIEQLQPPVEAKGAQGFWNWEGSL